MKEDLTHRIEKCPVCGVSYMPDNGDICECEETPVTEYEDAYKQIKWYDKLTELD